MSDYNTEVDSLLQGYAAEAAAIAEPEPDVIEPDVIEPAAVEPDVTDPEPAKAEPEKTVPFEQFNELVKSNKLLQEQMNKLVTLQLGQQPQQAQPAPKQEDPIEKMLSGIEDDYVSRETLQTTLRKIRDEQQKNFNERFQAIEVQAKEKVFRIREAEFAQKTPDYDEVAENIDARMAKMLYDNYEPEEAIKMIYALGKSTSALSAKAAPVAPAAAKPAVKPKPTTLEKLKGGTPPAEDPYAEFQDPEAYMKQFMRGITH
jgi:hypothetical protein